MPVNHVVRTRDGGTKKVTITRADAIKMMCVECLGWEEHPKYCTATKCPLYPFRGQTIKTNKGDV